MEELKMEDFMVRAHDLNPMVERFVKNQMQVFNEQTKELIIYQSEKMTVKQEHIYRATRFMEMSQHIEKSIIEIFGELFEIKKFISEDWRDDAFVYTFVVIDKFGSHITSIGFKTGEGTLRQIEDFALINSYFGGKR